MTQSKMLTSRAFKASLALLMGSTAMTGGFAAPALAQDTGVLDEIQVTGTRIRRADDFTTTTPTTVIDSSFMENLGIVNAGDALTQLPANLSSFQPTTTGNSAFFAGAVIANLRGLNPYFGSRTLTLVDTQRFVPTNQGDGVDMNFIPSILIERVETVTGGASAAYGSGAIAGVTNVLLNHNLEGFKIEADYGITDEWDGDDRHIGAAFGSSFDDGRGHLTIGGEWQKMDAIRGCTEARDWCAENWGLVSNDAGSPPGDTYNQIDPALPEFTIHNNVRRNQISTSGVFFNNFVNGNQHQVWQANKAGTGATAFNLGQTPASTILGPDTNVVGGDGPSPYEYTALRSNVDRYVGQAMVDYQLTEDINLSLGGSYGHVETTNRNRPSAGTHSMIESDNAFIQNSPDLMHVVGSGALFNKDWSDQIMSDINTKTEVWRVVAGLDGTFGNTSWAWDTYIQHGKTKREQLVTGNRHLVRYDLALDSVLDANGNPVCRVTRDGVSADATYDPRLADGCVPLNPFGTDQASQEALDYAFGFIRENLTYEQTVAAANANGNLFEGFGAGPVALAVGAEYRTEKGVNTAAEELPDYERTDFLMQYGDSFSGKVEVIEGYAELNVPVLSGVAGAEALELNGAIRQSRYKNTGLEGTSGETRKHDITTWKLSGFWDPVTWLRVRASQSRDIRAANFRELYYGQVLNSGGLYGYRDTVNRQDLTTINLTGNVNLKPEKSDTSTIGLVFTPSGALDGLQFAADYYRIKIKDAITPASSARVFEGCEAGIQEFCDMVEFGTDAVDPVYGEDVYEEITAQSFNARSYVVKGIDFSANYFYLFDDGDSLSARLVATHMIDQLVQPSYDAQLVDVAGMTGPNVGFLADFQSSPDWLGNLTLTYNTGPVSLTGQARYVSAGDLAYDGTDPSDPDFALDKDESYNSNDVSSHVTFNLSGSYTFDGVYGAASSLQLYFVVNNVLDTDPPVAPGGESVGGTNPIFFDTIGREFRIGARAQF